MCESRHARVRAVADGIPAMSLCDLTGLVMEDESYRSMYRMYRLLASDRLYFKQVRTVLTCGNRIP
jgi:hypothetical protein